MGSGCAQRLTHVTIALVIASLRHYSYDAVACAVSDLQFGREPERTSRGDAHEGCERKECDQDRAGDHGEGCWSEAD